MDAFKPREPQYQLLLDLRARSGLVPLGLRASAQWRCDPKMLLITLARYKFVAKMLAGKRSAVEIGCGDAFPSRLVQQEVGALCVTDFDPLFIQDVRDRMEEGWALDCRVHDILTGPVQGPFEAAYALDVIEHIPKASERVFMENLCGSLTEQGVAVIGMPSLESQAHASELSKQGHVNCMSHKEFKGLLGDFFHNVFLFSMNDEVIHTGFYPMAHYLMALCCTPRR